MNNYVNAVDVWRSVKTKMEGRNDFVIAIDGPDCSGKTTLSNKLLKIAESDGLEGVLLHMDDTFKPEVTRPRANPCAVSEFLLEFFNYEGLEQLINKCRGVVVVEGLFLLQPVIIELFDLTIRIELDERSVFERAAERDLRNFASWGNFASHYVSQALAAQRIYRALCKPNKVADMLVDLTVVR